MWFKIGISLLLIQTFILGEFMLFRWAMYTDAPLIAKCIIFPVMLGIAILFHQFMYHMVYEG